MKKLISSISVAVFMLSGLTSFAQSFSDVPSTNTYYVAIESLKNLDIVNGNPDGTFAPDRAVNRAEALKMILNTSKITWSDADSTSFPDVSSDAWFAKIVSKANKLGIVNGNPDGTFSPGRQVNKAEFLKMLLLATKADLSHHQNLDSGVSLDTHAGDWFLPYFSYAKTIGMIFPDTSNRLYPNQPLTRGQTAEIIYRYLIISNGGDVQKMLSIAESSLVSLLVNLGNNDINSALDDAHSAVFYTEQALKLSGDNVVVAANKIANGFLKLTLAYKAGTDGDTTTLQTLVDEAYALAGEAYNADPSTQNLGKKIKEQGAILLDQIDALN